MVDFESKSRYDVYDLERLIALLRAPGGCPWDAEQTHESLRRNMLEEAYEAAEAIDEGDPDHLKEELGDVLTQVIFHADIEREKGQFRLDDVADGVCRKLIFRHPHVFGDRKAGSADDVLELWDDVKRQEKHQDTVTDALHSVARSLPALWRAEKLQKKAGKAVAGSRLDIWDAMDLMAERLYDLSAVLSEGNGEAEEKLGELLFAAVLAARLTGTDPETALTKASDRFTERFAEAERTADGGPLDPETELGLYGTACMES
ncbi:MAG: nucleoside triphosphate pyrophosphohydrolase [Oscillospiraceae bacterium]|nr:nucleoside triphosphate pyrophosphohydrolase [Oscillospiraceae bacterium]